MSFEIGIVRRQPMINMFAAAIVYAFLAFMAISICEIAHSIAFADSGSALVVPGASLPDPVESPAVAWTDLELAHKVGWPVAVFGGLVMLTKGLAYVSIHLASVPIVGGAARWLALARNAAVVTGIGVVAVSLYDVLIAGGTWTAALIAGGLAVGGILHPSAAKAA